MALLYYQTLLQSSEMNCYSNEVTRENQFHPYFTVQNLKPFDFVLQCQSLDPESKLYWIQYIATNLPSEDRGQISSYTITLALEKKIPQTEYLELLEVLVKFAQSRSIKITTYNHLYHLILQGWMDFPNTIDDDFRSEIIKVCFGPSLDYEILNQIKTNAKLWFTNASKFDNYSKLFQVLFDLDSTGSLKEMWQIYIEKKSELEEKAKKFQKEHNMTIDEYQLIQKKAKSKGICAAYRENRTCSYGVRCMFYHGPIEDTYGFIKCHYGSSCKKLELSECRFAHYPTGEKLQKVINFYDSLEKESDGYLVHPLDEKKIDRKIQYDPFIILAKDSNFTRSDKKIYYYVPKCRHISKNEFGLDTVCHETIRIMTNRSNGEHGFYCSHEHMRLTEPNAEFVVKQCLHLHGKSDF